MITDDLESIAIEEFADPARSGRRLVRAGCDLVLYARNRRGSVQGFNALVAAVKEGRPDQAQIQASYERILSLKAQLASG